MGLAGVGAATPAAGISLGKKPSLHRMKPQSAPRNTRRELAHVIGMAKGPEVRWRTKSFYSVNAPFIYLLVFYPSSPLTSAAMSEQGLQAPQNLKSLLRHSVTHDCLASLVPKSL